MNGKRMRVRGLRELAGLRADQLMKIRLLLDDADQRGMDLRADDVRDVLEGRA